MADPENLILWDCAFPLDLVAFEDSAPDPDHLFKGNVMLMDSLNVFMDEIMSLLISTNLMSGIFLSRAEKKGFGSMDEILTMKLKKDGSKRNTGKKLMDMPVCKSVQEEAETMLKKKKFDDDDRMREKLKKLF
jgi:hypothetical protein